MIEPSIAEIIQMAMGAGIIGILLKINRELGGITSVMAILTKSKDDHEQRLRTLERPKHQP